jgi:hypothetical protein
MKQGIPVVRSVSPSLVPDLQIKGLQVGMPLHSHNANHHTSVMLQEHTLQYACVIVRDKAHTAQG